MSCQKLPPFPQCSLQFFSSFPICVCIGSLQKYQLSCSPAAMLSFKVWERRDREEQEGFSIQISARISLLQKLWKTQGVQIPMSWVTWWRRDCNLQKQPRKVLAFKLFQLWDLTGMWQLVVVWHQTFLVCDPAHQTSCSAEPKDQCLETLRQVLLS